MYSDTTPAQMPLETFLHGTTECVLRGQRSNIPNQMLFEGLTLHNKRLRVVVGELTIPTFAPEQGTLRVVLRDPGSYELEAADLPAATTVALRPIR